MSDIVERLRAWPDEPINNVSMLRQAADEIERLRAALEDCVAFMNGDIFGPDQRRGILAAARRALEPKP